MQITVEFANQAKAISGVDRINIEIDSQSTIVDIVRKACHEFGEALGKILLDSNENLNQSLLILVNDCHIFHDEPIFLNDGDRILLLPPISGG